MTIKTLISFLCISMLSSSLLAQKTFEGVVNLSITEGDQLQSLEIVTKDGKSAFDMTNKNGELIKVVFDKFNNDVSMIGDKAGKLVVMTYSMDLYLQMANRLDNIISDSSSTKINQTDQIKEINAFECKKYTYRSAKTNGSAWTSPKFNFDVFDILNCLQKTNIEVVSFHGGILEMQQLNSKTSAKFDIKVKPISKAIDENSFAIPEDAEILDMSMMFIRMENLDDLRTLKRMLGM